MDTHGMKISIPLCFSAWFTWENTIKTVFRPRKMGLVLGSRMGVSSDDKDGFYILIIASVFTTQRSLRVSDGKRHDKVIHGF